MAAALKIVSAASLQTFQALPYVLQATEFEIGRSFFYRVGDVANARLIEVKHAGETKPCDPID